MATRRVSYSTLVSESIHFAQRLKPMWLFGAFVLYLQAGYVVFFEQNIASLVEEFDFSSAALFGLLLPAVVVFLSVLHAAADGALITACVAKATGGTPTLDDAWQSGRSHTAQTLIGWLILVAVLVAWAGLTSGIPIVLGIVVHPVVGFGFGALGFGLFLITFLFLFPLGMFALREVIVDDRGLARAWQAALTLVRGNPARAAGITLVGSIYTLALWSVEILAVLLSGAIWVFARSTMPVPIAVAMTFVVLLPIYIGVRGWLGSALSYFWTLAYLWVRSEAEQREEA